MNEQVALQLQSYKDGKHVHLGHPNDCQLSPSELEEKRKVERAIIDAVYAYELRRGGIRLVDGLYEFDPEVLARLPRYRDNTNLHCCLEHDN